MSMMLNLADHVLANARNLQFLGRHQDALETLSRLSRFRRLSHSVAEEVQARLAELYLARGKLRKARRHIKAALVHRPACARYHHVMARALVLDEDGDKQTAADHYRKSLELDPQQPDCLGEYGMLMIELGQPDKGYRCLRRAVEMAPNDPEVLRKLVDVLEGEGRFDDIRRTLRAALFRNPRDARFRRMWDDFQFQQLWRDQAARSVKDGSQPESLPAVLPFVRPPLRIIRCDSAAAPASPHRPRTVGQSLRHA
jgi:tetratricopeptide (TPR) repeat protein